MKKVLIAVSVIAAGAIAAIPYYIGTKAQERFELAHERMQQDILYPQLTVTAGKFNHGWLKSEASTVFTITPDKKGAKPVVFTFVHHINQLPTPGEGALMTVDSELELPAEMTEKVKPYFHDKPLLSSHTVVKFDGSEMSTITSPSYNGPLHDDETATLNWQGLKATTTSDAELRHVTVELNVPALTLSKHDGTLEMLKLHYATQLQRGNHDLWLGSDSASLEKLQFQAISTKHGPANVLFSNVKLDGMQSEHGQLIDMSGKLTFDTAELNGLKLENGIYDVAYSNLDADSIVRIGEGFRQVMQQPGQDPRLFMATLMPQVRSLFSQKPELELRQLEVQTPMGKISGKLKVVLTEQLTDEVMQDPRKLLDMMNVDIEASLPKPMLIGIIGSNARSAVMRRAKAEEKTLTAEEVGQQVSALTQQQIQGMLGQKLMVEQDSNYATVIHYTPHQLVINDQDATPMIDGMLQH